MGFLVVCGRVVSWECGCVVELGFAGGRQWWAVDWVGWLCWWRSGAGCVGWWYGWVWVLWFGGLV